MRNLADAPRLSMWARVVTTAMVLGVSWSGALAVAPGQRLSEELRAKVDEYAVAWNTYDSALLARQFTTDADMIMGNGPLLHGRDAVQGWWQEYFAVQEGGRELAIEILDMRPLAADAAMITVETTTRSLADREADRRPRRARGTWVLVRPDGQWLIASLRGMPTEQDRIVRATPSAGDPAAVAERFFGSVYGCSGEGLDALAHPDVRMSYPVFADLFGVAVLEGRSAVAEFSAGFCRRWLDRAITVHEAISEPGRVVLIWSFSAISAAGDAASGTRTAWGGISIFEFDERGRVLLEFGEESTPGPFRRIQEP